MMPQNVIKIKTRKDDFKRIYQQDEIKHYIPRTKRVVKYSIGLFRYLRSVQLLNIMLSLRLMITM